MVALKGLCTLVVTRKKFGALNKGYIVFYACLLLNHLLYDVLELIKFFCFKPEKRSILNCVGNYESASLNNFLLLFRIHTTLYQKRR